MGKPRITTEATGIQRSSEKAPSAYHRLEAFVGIVDSGGLQLSTQTGKIFREALREKSAGESKRVQTFRET